MQYFPRESLKYAGDELHAGKYRLYQPIETRSRNANESWIFGNCSSTKLRRIVLYRTHSTCLFDKLSTR